MRGLPTRWVFNPLAGFAPSLALRVRSAGFDTPPFTPERTLRPGAVRHILHLFPAERDAVEGRHRMHPGQAIGAGQPVGTESAHARRRRSGHLHHARARAGGEALIAAYEDARFTHNGVLRGLDELDAELGDYGDLVHGDTDPNGSSR